MRADSPVLVQDQLFSMGTDDKRREANSQARGWDGGQSARAPGTPGLARAPTRRLIPWQFHTAERGKVWCFLPARAGRIRATIHGSEGNNTSHPSPCQPMKDNKRGRNVQICHRTAFKKKINTVVARGAWWKINFVIPFTNSSGKWSPINCL